MSTDNTIDQQFIQYIVQSIVSQPDAVKIDRSIDEKGVLLELTVAPDDLGRVIGKRGNTAQSLRTLLRALGTKNDARYNLKIVDVGGPKPTSAPAAAAVAATDDQSMPADDNMDAPMPEADQNNAEPSSGGADAWAHLRSEEPAEDTHSDQVDESSTNDGKDEPSVVEKTRKELEDLADINI
jgi:predicted RNA-binding protein YlqC (UPF0109 family)